MNNENEKELALLEFPDDATKLRIRMLAKGGTWMPTNDIVMNIEEKLDFYHYPFLLKIVAMGQDDQS